MIHDLRGESQGNPMEPGSRLRLKPCQRRVKIRISEKREVTELECMAMLGYLVPVLGWISALLGAAVHVKRKAEKKLLYPAEGIWFMVGFTVFFSTLLFCFTFMQEPVEELFLAFILLGVVGNIASICEVIKFDETGFWTFNLLGRKKRYEYEDVLAIKKRTYHYTTGRRTRKFTTIYLSRKRIRIEESYANYSAFMARMEGTYRWVHKRRIPQK
jgi:hypothetical protein